MRTCLDGSVSNFRTERASAEDLSADIPLPTEGLSTLHLVHTAAEMVSRDYRCRVVAKGDWVTQCDRH
jgi:hypothetical protein